MKYQFLKNKEYFKDKQKDFKRNSSYVIIKKLIYNVLKFLDETELL